MKKRLISLFIGIIIAVGMVPVTALAATAETVTEFVSSYDEENYFAFSVSDDMLTISGVYSDSDAGWLWVVVSGNSTEPFRVTSGQAFTHTMNLRGYRDEDSVTIEILSGPARYGTYYYIFVKSDIALAYLNGWGFDYNQIILVYNTAMAREWINPRDGLFDVSSEIKTLSDQIVSGTEDDYEKLRLIHNWVADNIYYDYDFINGASKTVTTIPEEVLEKRYCVCEGYARLFSALVQAQGIPCINVYGNTAQSDGWTENTEKILIFSHMWNEAFVDGRWITIDVTWDSMNDYENGDFIYGGVSYPKYFDISAMQLSDDHKTLFRGASDPADTPADWAQPEIVSAFEQALIPLSLAGNYGANITRAEFCNLIVALFESKFDSEISDILSEKGLSADKSVFTDCTAYNVQAAYALGIVSGRGGGIFDPNGEITRQEAAVMLTNTAKVLGLTSPTGVFENYTDSGDFASWAAESIAFISAVIDQTNGFYVMGGVGDDMFSAKTQYTRQQAFCTIIRLFNAL